MGKRGQKPKGKVKIKWSANFAYAIGLIVSDGCLSSDGRHVTLVSKDRDQIINFNKALDIDYLPTAHDGLGGKKAYRVQIGDVLFYNFLQTIGLSPAKSLTIGAVQIPQKYFFHYLRGYFDGDGCTYSYFDPRWRSSFMFYLGFACSSEVHIRWLQHTIYNLVKIKGHITTAKRKNTSFQLKYAKKEAIELLKKIYRQKTDLYLKRKYLKINKALAIVGKHI